MARRSWNVTDFAEMFRRWNAGRSQVQIHQALNIDRKTVRKYLAPALAEGLHPCVAAWEFFGGYAGVDTPVGAETA